jgi:phosphonate transport system ATP-binding protein
VSFSLDQVGLVHPNGHRALQGVSFAARAGERVAVIGPSGAGKTTLLRVLGAALRPGEGAVQLLGEAPWSLAAPGLRKLRSRIGTVHQSPPIAPRLRVVTAVLSGRLGQWSAMRALASLVRPADLAGAHEALSRLSLEDRLFERCDRLSGGQLQRVGIARVLYQRPALLLADEPASALDPTLADATLQQLVAQGEATGATLVASLHAVDLALRWFPRIVGMRDGRVVFDEPVGRVTKPMLVALYASEGRLPMQAQEKAHEQPYEQPPGTASDDAVPGSANSADAALRPDCL